MARIAHVAVAGGWEGLQQWCDAQEVDEGGALTHELGALPLEGGGEIVFQVVPGAVPVDENGPVKAGRIADAARRVPQTLQQALVPVQDMTRAVVACLREAGPTELEVEFGLDLSGQVGVIVNKGEAAAHLRIKALWRSGPAASGDA